MKILGGWVLGLSTGLVNVLIKIIMIKNHISCEEAHVICEKVDMWSAGSKPVSQEEASLPIKSSMQKSCMLTTQLASRHYYDDILYRSRDEQGTNAEMKIIFNTLSKKTKNDMRLSGALEVDFFLGCHSYLGQSAVLKRKRL